jgi:tripartite-type tricarboxylate transporter receptor subunit TctC
MMTTPATIIQYEKAGSMVVLATDAAKAGDLYPGVPTMKTLGYGDQPFSSWHVLYGPKDMPKSIVQKLTDACRKAVQSPRFQEFAKRNFLVVLGGTPEDAENRLVEDAKEDPRLK